MANLLDYKFAMLKLEPLLSRVPYEHIKLTPSVQTKLSFLVHEPESKSKNINLHVAILIARPSILQASRCWHLN